MRIMLLLVPLLIAAGPISKFDDKAPDAVFQTTTELEQVERCLIDMNGWLAPNVYRQPDRPDQSTLIWTGANGISVGRVDLERTAQGTRVRSWFPAKQIQTCAPVRR